MSFGLHGVLRPGARYVTVLREPVARVLSEYRFLKTNTRHPFHAAVAPMSLAEFLDSDFSGQSRDGQTRLLSGDHEPGRPGIAGRGRLEASHLQRALANLDRHFLVAATQDRFAAGMLLLARRLGWRRYPFYMPRNRTAAASNHETVDPRDHDRIAELNALDIALYEAVSDRFDAEVAAEGVGFARSLSRFERLNPVYCEGLSRWMQLRGRWRRRRR